VEQEPILMSGRRLTIEELEDVKYIIGQFSHLSRNELAKTICEGLDWFAPNGKYKKDACLHLLEKLEEQGEIVLPEKRMYAMRDSYTNYTKSDEVNEQLLMDGSLSEYAPITLTAVCDTEGIRLWNSFIERYHMLGYKRPFGAHQRYFIVSGTEPALRLGCLLFSASAWALAERDQWLGWSKETRSERLLLIVNNTRFLIFPWVKIKNLASKALALASRQIIIDWQERYGYTPVLLETFVDTEHYTGTCYRASNWIDLGLTAGRGRMDRYNERALSRKRIFVYPLVRDFRAQLCDVSSGERNE
jgi:hypothetical protein